MKILFLSHTYWDSYFMVGSHQLAKQYLNQGYDVFYISTPLSFFHFIKKSDDVKNRLKTMKPKKKGHLFTYIPFRIIPFKNFVFFRNIKNATKCSVFFKHSFNKISKKYLPDRFDLVLIDTPSLTFLLKLISYDKIYYRITDFYSNMDGRYFKEIEDIESILINDLSIPVIATSSPIKEYYDNKYNINSFLFENGVNLEHFLNFDRNVFPIEYSNRKKIVYIGALDQRFDWNLVYKVVARFKNVDVYIIGPTDKTSSIDNLHILGGRLYEDIPAYLLHADIGIMPFIKSRENEGRSPMKIYEYGICGLPTVVMETTEIKKRNHEFIFISKNYDEFICNIEYCLNHDMSNIQSNAKKEALKHSWKTIAKNILKL